MYYPARFCQDFQEKRYLYRPKTHKKTNEKFQREAKEHNEFVQNSRKVRKDGIRGLKLPVYNRPDCKKYYISGMKSKITGSFMKDF